MNHVPSGREPTWCSRTEEEEARRLYKLRSNEVIVSRFRRGEMLEWLKRHAWKACKLQKGFRGSNPRLSARKSEEIRRRRTQTKQTKNTN